MPALDKSVVYESGDWEVDVTRRELRDRGTAVPIGGRAFEIIETFVRSAGELVTKDDLMAHVWPGTIVEENTLQVHISAVRKALGRDRGLLKTVSGRGYRLLGTWKIRQKDPASRTAAPETFPTPTQSSLRNFPAAASDLIGRTAAVQELRDLLSAYRVVTLTGPGGIGKTRLALEVARSLFPDFRGDGWLVELASLLDPELVPSAVAGVLGLKLGSEISPEAVALAISEKEFLLVLDNCEHLIDAVAGFIEFVVRLCPRITVLVTSREVIRIEGEYVYRVPPLDVPPEHQMTPNAILEHGAVRLFIDRTKMSDADFLQREEDLPTLATICRRLDGIPLAIEFAAAHAVMVGIRQVASRLDDRFRLLTHGRRTALPRHQTLRATLDWSYELLSPSEQRLLRHLAVFSSGFTLDAVSAVMGAPSNTPLAILDGIASLVAKSLVTLDVSIPTSRWRLLETIRAYAQEKLKESGEAPDATRHYAEYFRDFCAAITLAAPLQPGTIDMSPYSREIDNVRAAIDWSFSAAGESAVGITLTAAYAPVWQHLSLLGECGERAEAALAQLTSNSSLSMPLRMQLYTALGVGLLFKMGSVESTKIAVIKALEIAESLDNTDAQLRALWALCAIYLYSSECFKLRDAAQRFSRVANRIGDAAAEIFADRITAVALQYAGNNREAQTYIERVIERHAESKDGPDTTWFRFDQPLLARAIQARILGLRGHLDEAMRQARTILKEAEATNHEFTICGVIHYALSPITFMTGDLAAAEEAVAILIELAKRVSATSWEISANCLEAKVLIKRGEFSRGVALMRVMLDRCDKTGWTVWQPEFLGSLAEGLAGMGKPAEAVVAIDQALASADRGGERWYIAELFRIKGDLLLQDARKKSISQAENCFDKALDSARQQDALFWELRGALSLARLRIKQDRRDEARQVLAPVYERFTEGFETADLVAARSVLQSLNVRSV